MNLGGTGWIWEELGGSGRNWVKLGRTWKELGGTRWNWVDLVGTGRNWVGTGRKLGESWRSGVKLGRTRRNWVELGGSRRDWVGTGWISKEEHPKVEIDSEFLEQVNKLSLTPTKPSPVIPQLTKICYPLKNEVCYD